MGNTQSAPAPRRPPNKLSKPRTNNSSTANLPSTKTPLVTGRRNSQSNHGFTSVSRYSIVSVDGVVSHSSENLREEPQRKRMSLFRSKSSQPKILLELEIDTGVERGFVDPSPVDRPVHSWSRSERSYSDTFEFPTDQPCYNPPAERPPIRNARMSLQHVPHPQHYPRLSLVAEAPSPQPQLAEGSRRLSRCEAENNSEQNSRPLGPRTNSDTQLYGPIRRRSLQQHGIATRNSFVETEPWQSLPSQIQSRETPSREDFQNYYYNPAKPTSSPLSDLVALGRNPDDLPGERTKTPSDLEYGHTGVYKLGSLRITNGAASPSPSIDRPGTSGTEDDYLKMKEGRTGGESNHHQGLSKRSNTFNMPTDARKPWVTRSESPLRQSHELGAFEPLTIDIQIPFPDPSFAQFDFFRSTESPTKSLELAHEYVQDLALSPFSFDNSPLPSPRLLVNSKHTAVEDDLFEPEQGTPNPDADDHVPRSCDSGYSGSANSQGKEPGTRNLAPKPLAKADSGYSSNVSLRSFKSREAAPVVPTKESPPPPPKEPVSRETVSRVTSSTYSVASNTTNVSEMTVRTKRSLPALPTEKTMPAQPFRQAPPVPSKTPEQTWSAALVRNPVVVRPQQPRHRSIPPLPMHKAVRGTYTPADSHNRSPPGSEVSVSSSNGSSSRWRGGKRRPQSVQPQPVFTVQAVRPMSPALSIPPVSKEASRKLEERVDGFPVACFPNTLRGENGLRRTVSKETLGTIFSVGSAEFREEPTFARLQSALPPVPEPTSSGPNPDFNRRHTYQIPTPLPSLGLPTTRRTPTRKSLQPQPIFQNQPTSNIEFEPHLTSYNNISSLGKSPYDLDLSTSKPEATPFVPQSVPSAASRAKLMTSQLEADAAERFARVRRESQEQALKTRKSYDHSVGRETQSTALQSRRSYGSIVNANPFSASIPVTGKPYVPTQAATGYMRTKSSKRPPLAHKRFSSPNLRGPLSMLPSQSSASFFAQGQIQNRSWETLQVDKDDEGMRRFSMLSRGSQGSRVKSPPPVSMQTQRKMVPTNLGNNQIIPLSRTPPPAPEEAAQPPNRTPVPPGHQFQSVPSNGYDNVSGTREQEQGHYEEREFHDHWATQRDFWASRRQSAREALQTRKSMELRRPESTRPSLEYQRPPLMQQSSYDYVAAQSRENEPKLRQSIEMKRPESARPSFEYGRAEFEGQMKQPGLSHHVSFDNSQQSRGQRYSEYGHSAPLSHEPAFYSEDRFGGEYDHTYGSHNKENIYSHTEPHEDMAYYDGPSQDDAEYQDQQYLPQAIHQNSTEDMLTLDRYEGGLGYSYEPGYGLGGSAGMRNVGKMAAGERKSVDVSMQYGIDFSDVPVFLQRVKVQG